MKKHFYFVIVEVKNGFISKVEEYQMDDFLESAFPVEKPEMIEYKDFKTYGFGVCSSNKEEQTMFKNIFVSLIV